jgi:hypothetical protein
MSQPTCHIAFAHHPRPSFHNDRTLFLPKIPVFGWSTTTVQSTNGWSVCWVHPGSIQPASTPWHSPRAATMSHRPPRTWPTVRPSFVGPTMPRRCAVPMASSVARVKTSFSRPCSFSGRKKVRFSSPPVQGTSFGNAAPPFRNMRSLPQGARMASFQNGNGPFGYSRR